MKYSKIAFFLIVSNCAQAQSLPRNFLGDWSPVFEGYIATDQKNLCKQGDFDLRENDSLMKISPKEIRQWESACDVKKMKQESQSVSISAACWDEDKKYTIDITYSIYKMFGLDVLMSFDKKTNSSSAHYKCIGPRAGDKILVGSHVGGATILEAKNINSSNAYVNFRREIDDEAETCAREQSLSLPKDIAACAKRLPDSSRRILRRRADCAAQEFFTEFGDYVLSDAEKVGKTNDKSLVRTVWLDSKKQTPIGNCSACNTPQLNDTMRLLCPSLYKKISDGGNLY